MAATDTHRAITTLLLVIISCVLRGAEVQPIPGKLSTEIDEFLWWLPADTETVWVTQTPARPRGPLFEAISAANGQIEFGDVGYSAIAKRHLATVRVKASVQGSRRFAPPSGLGGTLYEGATIYLFEKPMPAGGKSLMTELEKLALGVEQIGAFKVVEFRDKLENDIWASYITMPRPDVLLVATNREYLKELLGRTATRTGARALPADLPEWRTIDRSAPFWAMRHYRRDHNNQDPTSPFVKDASASQFDTGAVGLTTHATLDGRTLVVHYLSTGPGAEKVARRIWHHPGDGVIPTIRSIGGDTIEVRFTATDEEHLSMFLFYLMAALGHATYL